MSDAAMVPIAQLPMSGLLRRHLRSLEKPNWHVKSGFTRLVARNLNKTPLMLVLLAQEAKANPESDWIRVEPGKRCRNCEAVGARCECGSRREEERLSADDMLGLDLGVTGREIREAFRFLAEESLSLLEVSKGRGEGYQFRSKPERFAFVPFRQMRRCRPRDEAPVELEPEPETQTYPAQLDCPAGIAQCPVQALIHIDGVLTNRGLIIPPGTTPTPPPGTRVPTSNGSPPPGGGLELGTRVPDSFALEELKRLIVSFGSHVALPDDKYLAQNILGPLGEVPVSALAAVSGTDAIRRKIQSAALLVNLVPDAIRTFQGQQKSAIEVSPAPAPVTDEQQQCELAYESYCEEFGESAYKQLSEADRKGLEQLAVASLKRETSFKWASLPKAEQPRIVRQYICRQLRSNALSFEDWQRATQA